MIECRNGDVAIHNGDLRLTERGSVMSTRLVTATLIVKRFYTVDDSDYADWAGGAQNVTPETIRQVETISVKADPLMFIDFADFQGKDDGFSDTLTVNIEVEQLNE
jgi:hypothetical protein